MSNHFGFGIVDKTGKPYLKTCAISDDSESLERAVEWMNKTPSYGNLLPFKVVQLTWSDGNGN